MSIGRSIWNYFVFLLFVISSIKVEMPNFIPNHYLIETDNNLRFAYSPKENAKNINVIRKYLKKSHLIFNKYFSFPEKYEVLHIIFNSVDDFFKITNKKVSNTSLMVLEANDKIAIISCFSLEENPINGNIERMQRHLIHELMHIWLSIETKSNRLIGDSLKDLNIPSWLDEGLSEYVSLKLTDNNTILEKCELVFAEQSEKFYSYNFNFSGKDASFYYRLATGKVVATLGLKNDIVLSSIKNILKYNY